MIQGFTDVPSAAPGHRVMLRVATDAPEWQFHVHRQGVALVHCHTSGWIDGAGFRGEEHVPWDDWGKPGTRPDGGPAAGWTGYVFDVPESWRSGAYIFTFVEGDGSGRPLEPLPDLDSADARRGKALLVLRSATPGETSPLLYKLPLFTYQAYNTAGGSSIYQRVDVSLRRPGGGTGGTPWDSDLRWLDKPNHDPWDLETPRQSFAHWDAKMIAWLERERYCVDYCTDWDLHRPDAPALLAHYALVLSVGHDEYYSAPMRTHLEAFLAAGGNLAFFSGNTCWWRAELDELEPFRLRGQQRIQRWSDAEIGLPEDALTGVSFRHGGEGDHDRVAIGYTVQHTGAWPFEGTGLLDGDVLGAAEGLVGYECDGAPYDKQAPRPVRPNGEATPPGFLILATADVAAFTGSGNQGATMGMFRRGDGGSVFTAATTDWARVLAGGEERVAAITRNVLDRFGALRGMPSVHERFEDLLACDGCFASGEPARVSVVATSEGGVYSVSVDDDGPTCVTRVTTVEGLRDLSDAGVDLHERRHAVACTEDGDVLDLHWALATPRAFTRLHLGHFEGVFRAAGCVARGERGEMVSHALVATDRGHVYLISQRSDTRAILRVGNYPGVVDVGACFDARERVTQLVVGQADGTLTAIELSVRGDAVARRAPLGRIAGLSRLHASWVADDAFLPQRVLVTTRDGRHHELRHYRGMGTIRVARGKCRQV
jgi:hypothetical protein